MGKRWVRAFGEGVRKLREARGWTQYQLAAHAGVSQSVIRDVERGKDDDYTPHPDTIKGIVSALGEEGLQLLRDVGRGDLAEHLGKDFLADKSAGLELTPAEQERLRFLAQELVRQLLAQAKMGPPTQDSTDADL